VALIIGHEDLMEPVLYRSPFTAPGWIFELKVDGFRALARRRGAQIELLSRRGREMGEQFPEIVAALRRIEGDWHFDAELVVPDQNGLPAWERLRRRAVMRRQWSINTAASAEPAALCVFDILAHGDEDLRSLSTLARKARLQEAIESAPPGIQLLTWLEAHGEVAFAKACELDLEGVVAKRIDAPYQAGKRPAWRKIKNPEYSRQEALGFR